MHKPSIAVFLLVGVVVASFAHPAVAATKKPVVLVPRKLDGVWVAKGQENKYPVAVMIDNHTSARPQSGLQHASVVYETLAEGGIPRFMAVYADANIKEVGPVRSTRPYFVRYAAELNAAMAHAGGSPDGLKLLTKLRMPNFEGLKGAFAKYFFRAHARGVHGLYTSMSRMYQAVAKTKLAKVKPLYRNWKFADGPQLAQRPGGKHGATIDLGYGRSYVVEYRYDRKKNAYLRMTGGRAHIDRLTKKQISVRNVLIFNVPKEKVLDRKGRLDIKVTGRDSGYLLKDGKVVPIVWSKKSDRTRTVVTDRRGNEIVFNRGNTWVTVVPRGHKYRVF